MQVYYRCNASFMKWNLTEPSSDPNFVLNPQHYYRSTTTGDVPSPKDPIASIIDFSRKTNEWTEQSQPLLGTTAVIQLAQGWNKWCAKCWCLTSNQSHLSWRWVDQSLHHKPWCKRTWGNNLLKVIILAHQSRPVPYNLSVPKGSNTQAIFDSYLYMFSYLRQYGTVQSHSRIISRHNLHSNYSCGKAIYVNSCCLATLGSKLF